MDVKAFEKARADKLNEYKKEYESMKRDYSASVDAAIQEGDPKEQNELIQQVLSLNSDLSEYLRTVIGDLNKGDNSINSATVNDLNAELVKYQQDFQAVKASQDKLTTLKKIKATNSGLQDSALTTYYIYLTVIGILVIICVYFTISTAWTTSLVARLTTASAPVTQPSFLGTQ